MHSNSRNPRVSLWLGLLLLSVSVLTSACLEGGPFPWLGDDDDTLVGDDDDTSAPCEPMSSEITIGTSERPAVLKGPPGWCANHPIDVVFLLHGYGATAEAQDFLFGLSDRLESDNFLLVLPDGTIDESGRRFWNGPPGCCDFYGSGIDDVAYLSGLIDDIEALATITNDKVYFTGHSNGGFMSYRMACERPQRVQAIASLAGSGYPEADDCSSDEPVSVLQIHGVLDTTIFYQGAPDYPGARVVTERWAARAGCDITASEVGENLDLVNNLSGDETEVSDYSQGCADGFGSSLWTIIEGTHVPLVNDNFAAQLILWLRAH